MLFPVAWAQAAAAAPQPSIIEQSFPFILILGVFFFLIIRPAQKRSQTQKSMMGALKRGDNVITSSGILGSIEGMTEQYLVLEIADGVRIRILKNQISGLAEAGVAKK